MSSAMGHSLHIQLFGESHGPLVGVTLQGLPPGFEPDEEALQVFLRRRAGGGPLATGRREADTPRIVSGLYKGRTTGYPLTALFDNADIHSQDYYFLPDRPRPGHADFPALEKSGGFDDLRGSGHHSGRLTLPYAFAGGLCKQLLEAEGIRVYGHLRALGEVVGEGLNPVAPDEEALRQAAARPVPALSPQVAQAMEQAVREANGDSLGGLVECVALGLPPGLGEPFFEGVEALAAAHFFSIPAVKGVEFGAGFASAQMQGSAYNDSFCLSGERVVTQTNHAGGLLGGLTTGMPLVARVGFRPTPSIALEQQTVSLSQKKEATLAVEGRHDPCVAIRAVPVAEGALALALCDLWLERRGNTPWGKS